MLIGKPLPECMADRLAKLPKGIFVRKNRRWCVIDLRSAHRPRRPPCTRGEGGRNPDDYSRVAVAKGDPAERTHQRLLAPRNFTAILDFAKTIIVLLRRRKD
jgi:hypothetical protein